MFKKLVEKTIFTMDFILMAFAVIAVIVIGAIRITQLIMMFI